MAQSSSFGTSQQQVIMLQMRLFRWSPLVTEL